MSSAAASPPLVSVIVPAFNAALTLREALESALASSYRDIQIIIVDDGSTDGTAAIAEEFVRTDRRVQFHRQPNGGISAALNSGFAIASGDYIARLDADDVWHPSKLARQVELALREPELAFIYTWVRYIDARGCVIRDAVGQQFPKRALCRGLYESLVGGNSSALIKRSAVAAAGGCDEALRSFEDLLLQLTITSKHAIGFIPQYLVGYRVRPGSLSSDPQNMHESWRQARRRIMRLFPQIPRKVHAWAQAKRSGELAEAFAWRGRPAQAAALLLQALWHDPEWTIRFLQFRWARHSKLARSPRVVAVSRPSFLACLPEENIWLDEYEICTEARQLRRLDRRRAAWLGALDASLVPRDEAG